MTEPLNEWQIQIKKLRKKYSVAEIAGMCNLHKNTIWKLYRGENKNPTSDTIKKLNSIGL
jgi:transcriptional regulator with XRE-family HTH domain